MTAGLSRRTLLAGLLAPAPERGWLRLPDLPEAFGGQFAGVHRGALIVAGGSRFPVPLEEGGTKKWFADVFVLTGRGGPWRRFMLPRPLGYGGSVSHRRGVLLIGGSSEDGHTESCLWLRWNGQSIETEDAPPLPELTCAAPAFGFPGGFAIAGGSDGTLDRQAAALGARHPGFSRNLKVFDLQRQRWSVAGAMPFSLVTTTAAVWDGLAVIPGGETRPGHRSPAVWALPLAALGRA